MLRFNKRGDLSNVHDRGCILEKRDLERHHHQGGALMPTVTSQRQTVEAHKGRSAGAAAGIGRLRPAAQQDDLIQFLKSL